MRNHTSTFLLGISMASSLVVGLSNSAVADVKLPSIISNHAVLQRDTVVPVWGWAEPGEVVTAAVGDQTKTTTTDAKGKWMVKFDKLKSGGPFTLTVKGKNTIEVKDVLVGEVWLGSGQSNMAGGVNGANDAATEKAAANLPQIRMFTVASSLLPTAGEDCKGSWIVCSPNTVAGFSAALFFCGREIHKTLGLPVGLINSSVGGAHIEMWISQDPEPQVAAPNAPATAAVPAPAPLDLNALRAKYESELAGWDDAAVAATAAKKPLPPKPIDPAVGRSRIGAPGRLYNGMIAPIIPYAIRGMLWYQGESNALKNYCTPEWYQYLLPMLIKDWRTKWGYDFPVAWVQLPNYDTKNIKGDGWMVVQEAMLKSLKVPNTGMVVAIDIGEAGDIHPKNKQDVGRRLSLWALGAVYGQKVSISGPLPAGHKVNGSELVCSFTHADGGLVAKGDELKGFMIAGADKNWMPANTKIVGTTVVVSHPDIKEPIAARYAWADNPDCNLYNGEGLPASPFRTDTWSGIEKPD